MIFFASKKPNLDAIACKLLKKLKVNSKTIEGKLQEHPEYPSILSLNDCLTELKVANQTLRINKENYKPEDLMFPFVTHFNIGEGKFVLVNAIENGKVDLSDDQQDNIEISEEDFLKYWTGISLFSEVDEMSGEKNYTQNRFKYLLLDTILPLGFFLSLTMFSLLVTAHAFSWGYFCLALIKLIGLGITTLLLIQGINANNPLIQSLCNFAGKNNCVTILKSDAARITSWLSWSEVGFFYFAGSLLSLLLLYSSLALLVWLNLFSLPYTIYSVTYQYKVKNWCILCCSVQVLLWLELLSNIIFESGQPNFNLSLFSLSFREYLILGISFLTPVFLWAFLKPYFLNTAKLRLVQQQLKKFKYNVDLFKQVLTNQRHYIIGDDVMPIILGNPEAETVITMVSNPFCEPCGKAHQVIDEWLATRDDIQLKVVFTTSNDNNDRGTRVARHVSALSLLLDKTIAEKALKDWYKHDTKKYEDWAKKYPVSFNGEISSIEEKQRAWCAMAEITFTPTIFINGYKLPEPYRLEDVSYLTS
ncbi:thioredoxin domain-containing protein [Pedobacter sp. HDW13]|uniref:cysteine peptidase family C39 domain-containing protein n=1 Tax=Pedobacter sp. HDW13 TaxID=2714940 RepID=UPI0014083C28|nr:cysteine peptidase family C39 domain-containing protein [Pedobacter sp. HDW13]QIL40272.1 thioredoxin domain-containing protein [Pedobacter sp. HDW13]